MAGSSVLGARPSHGATRSPTPPDPGGSHATCRNDARRWMTRSPNRSVGRSAGTANRNDARRDVRRAAEIQLLDRFQAGIDAATGDAVAKLITALSDTKGAVLQMGSVLLVKVDETLIVRQLTSREMLCWQQNPGLFRDPAKALAELQRAMEAHPSQDSRSEGTA